LFRGAATAEMRVSGDREHGFHRIVSNDFRGS
jgi:acid stress-induced BolA-like protein IbaG/YrbA